MAKFEPTPEQIREAERIAQEVMDQLVKDEENRKLAERVRRDPPSQKSK